jgi:hypothetical protein
MAPARMKKKKKSDPDVLIKLDPTDYIEDKPEYMLLGGQFLAIYVAITEQFINHKKRPAQSVTYYIEPATDPKTANETIIYQSNGLVVVDRK